MIEVENPPPLAAMPLAEVLRRIASTAPVPGAGAAAALACSLGLACALKAVRLSAAHHPDEAAFHQADERLAAIMALATVAADEDARLFGAMIAALRLPHEDEASDPGDPGDPPEADARHATIIAAAADLVAAGGRLLRAVQEAERVIAGIRPLLTPVMAGDAVAATALLTACATIVQANVDASRRYLAA